MNISKSAVLNTLNIPNISSFEQLAERMSISKQLLYFMSFYTENYYDSKTIKKKNGTLRQLYAPRLPLKVVQRWILKEILEKIKLSPQAMAFVPGKNGLKVNAEFHKDQAFILEMDLTDFFNTIRGNDVYRLFRNIGYNSDVSAILMKLCTYHDILPQGAVTSPYIANLAAYHLDARLEGLCGKRDIVYTRYADDLSFSCNNRTALNRIERIIKEIVADEGFQVNESKTRYLSNHVRKTVTGITINDGGVHVSKAFKKDVRTKIYKAVISGDYSNADQIRGSVSYIDSIEPGYKEKMIRYITRIISKPELMQDGDIIKAYHQNKIFKELPDM